MIDRPVRVMFHRVLLVVLVCSGLIVGQVSADSITLPQANGETLTLSGPAQRIITLAPNLAELVFAVGAGGNLKAVVEYSNYPAQVTQLSSVGDAFRIDLERIIELDPDLVIAWKSGNPQTALQKLNNLGVTVWQVEITHPDEIASTVENIARATGKETVGLPLALQLRRRLDQLRRQNAGKTPVTYFYQVAARPLYTINDQHIISRSLEICGGQNIFSELPTLAPQISRESVILANPQSMIAPETRDNPTPLAVWRDWPEMLAVKNGSLLYLPADEISQATPRLLDSIELACKLLDDVRITSKQVEK